MAWLSVRADRNGCSTAPESLFGQDWNQCSGEIGISVRLASESAFGQDWNTQATQASSNSNAGCPIRGQARL